MGENIDEKDLLENIENPIHIAILRRDSPPLPDEFCDCGQRIGDYGCPYCGE